jgi:hypothetical protein
MEPASYAGFVRMNLKTAQRYNPGIVMTIVIVEGSSDHKLYSQIFNPKKTIIEPVEGKHKVFEVVKLMLRDFPQRVIGIVDDDFDSLEGKCCSDPNIISTDAHDFETQIIFSSALEKLSNHVLPDKKRAYISQFVDELKAQLVKNGRILGYLRWVSKKENLRINFKQLPYKRVVNLHDEEIDISLVIDEVLPNTSNLNFSKEYLLPKIEELQKEKVDPKFLCQGHDLVNILVVIVPDLLKSYFSIKDEAYTEIVDGIRKPNSVRNLLILAYEINHFRKTRMYTKIKQWENKNQPTGIMCED